MRPENSGDPLQLRHFAVASSGTQDESVSGLQVDIGPNPLPSATLGDLGFAVTVKAAGAFAPRLIVLPMWAENLVGLDGTSVRLFRVRRKRLTFEPLWDSGLGPGFIYLWARVRRPGMYIAIGLPSDPFLRHIIRDLADRRKYSSQGAAEYNHLTTMRAFAGFAELPETDFKEVRSLLTRAELLTNPQRFAPGEIRRGRAGAILPPPLPRGVTLAEFMHRLNALETPPDGLPEEALFSIPDNVSAPAPASVGSFFPDYAESPAENDSSTSYLTEILGGIEQPEIRSVVSRIILPPRLNWWMYHHDTQHSGNVAGSHISRQNVGRLRLRARISLSGPVVSVPAVVDNKIYVGVGNSTLAAFGSGGTLYRIDLLTGQIERQFTFNTPVTGGSRQGLAGIACAPAVTGGRVYFSGQDGRIYCLNAATFTPVWVTDLRHADPAHNQPVTHRVNAEGWSSPLVIDGRVYVGFGESESNTFGFMYCLDADSGNVVWLFATNIFPGVADNEPNVIPESAVGVPRLPPGFTAHTDPVQRGSAPWSSGAYDPVSGRIFIGTGNVLPQHPLPQPKYSLGVLSLLANTGSSPRFFQPSAGDNYRPDDSDVDVASGPTIFYRGRQRIVAIGSKCGSFFLLDADTMEAVHNGRRQLLPRAGGNGGFPGDTGLPLPNVDPHSPDPGEGVRTENFYGIFGSAGVHYELERLFVGVGGFAFGIGTPGIDYTTTAFLRALNWNDLTDAWLTQVGPDGVRRYVVPRPPMYTTPGEAGFTSPVVVNDLVLVTTSRPALYALDAETGLGLWTAPGFGAPTPNSFTLGPAVFGDFVVVGSANLGLMIYSL